MTTAYGGSGDLNRSMELLWQGENRSSRGPKPALSLEQIVAAAVRLADRDGLSALSMRSVAAELGVGTMSLYRYVPGKAELLDLMLDYTAGSTEDLDEHTGKGWRATMEHMARGIWRMYHEHPWLLQVNQARPILGPKALAALDFVLASLDGLGLSSRERVSVIMAVEHYVTGTARTYILAEQAVEESGISDEDFWAAQVPILEKALATGAYPQVFRLDEDAFGAGGIESLEFGLKPLLDGLEIFIRGKGGGS